MKAKTKNGKHVGGFNPSKSAKAKSGGGPACDRDARGHTPGPWEFVPGGGNDAFYVEECGQRAILATVETCCGWERANARLIAAAPELLAALDDASAAIEAICRDCKTAPREALREINRRNRAAIEKATGDQSPV